MAAYTLLTSSERKDQATRAKSVAGTKRSRSYPEDEETECLDATLNPFAEWPWEQSLRLTPRWHLAGLILRSLPGGRRGSRPKNGMGPGGPPVVGVSPDHGAACLVDSDVRRTRNNSTGVGASLVAGSRRLTPSTGGIPCDLSGNYATPRWDKPVASTLFYRIKTSRRPAQ